MKTSKQNQKTSKKNCRPSLRLSSPVRLFFSCFSFFLFSFFSLFLSLSLAEGRRQLSQTKTHRRHPPDRPVRYNKDCQNRSISGRGCTFSRLRPLWARALPPDCVSTLETFGTRISSKHSPHHSTRSSGALRRRGLSGCRFVHCGIWLLWRYELVSSVRRHRRLGFCCRGDRGSCSMYSGILARHSCV